jgi:hypothetical protein
MLYSTIVIFISPHLGSLFLSTNIVSRTNARMIYWSQFSSHKIQAVKGIKWYISNILVRCGFIAFIDEVATFNNYVDNEAVLIYLGWKCRHRVGDFFSKTTDTPTCCVTCRRVGANMSGTLSLVGSSDAVSMSCWHDNYPACLHMSAKKLLIVLQYNATIK